MSFIDRSIHTYSANFSDYTTQIKNPASDIYYPAWNNFESGDIGEAMLWILSAFSHTVDHYRSYYLNNLYLPTDEIISRDQIYEMLNYKSGLKRAMVLTVNFMWKGCGPIGYVTIPKFFKLSLNADGVDYTFLTLNKAIYMPNASRLYVDVVLGDFLELNLTTRDIINNKILVSTKEMDSSSLTLIVDDVEWTQVRNIYYETDTTKRYSVHRESDGTYIYLSSDWLESVPSEISEISVRGAVLKDAFDINTKEAIKICLLDSLICSLDEDVTNQFNVYLMKTQNASDSGSTGKRRIITLDDYESEAKSYAGILDARAFNFGEGYSLGITDPNTVRMVAIGESGVLGDFIQKGLKEYIESISLREINFDFIDPVFKKIDLKLIANIGGYKDSVFQPEIYQAIRSAIEGYMVVKNLGIGKAFNSAELLSTVSRSDSRIKFLDLRDYVAYTPLLNEVMVLGTLSIDFYVESSYRYDIAYISESYSSWGPLGVEFPDTTETLVNLEAYIYVGEEILWDAYFPNAEIIDRSYFEEIISGETLSPIEILLSDPINLHESLSVSSFYTESGSLTDSKTLTHRMSESLRFNEGGAEVVMGGYFPITTENLRADSVRIYNLGSSPHTVTINYGMLSEPDRIYITYKDVIVADTGLVSGSGNLVYNYVPSGGVYTIKVYGVAGNTGSVYFYTIYVP